MKKTMMKSVLAAAMLAGAVVGQGSVSNAAGTTPAVAAATAVPIMRDNLAKYGLVKDVELPVTVTAGGLSYTLEKIMIYETKSDMAQAVIKKYGYTGTEDQKYFIWTKITIVNNSKALVQFSSKDLNSKWRFNFGEEAWTRMPEKLAEKTNSTVALWGWELAPGKKLSTYQAYSYDGDFKWFYVSLSNKGAKAYLDVVKN
ncbi:hypothetical protein [Paenibacillus sp. P46E]|uniref:hypothetical protein n=1 Tax=Paenibacillus sp. P46E TaxID=1349436 RepID=UPI000AC7A1AD|nr:hypothetical protein [Paenibacillus sp. P46E]